MQVAFEHAHQDSVFLRTAAAATEQPHALAVRAEKMRAGLGSRSRYVADSADSSDIRPTQNRPAQTVDAGAYRLAALIADAISIFIFADVHIGGTGSTKDLNVTEKLSVTPQRS